MGVPMTATRRYRLLCPIARALDRLGDRWALLILRDLHAGPARFSELHAGLAGIASNLLTSRLEELQADELVRRIDGDHQIVLYELTPLGRHTAAILYELAAFGSRLPVDPDPRPPGNHRTLAVTLSVACTRVVDPSLRLDVELRIDGEPYTMRAADGRVEVRAGSAVAPAVVIETPYEAMVAAADGELSMAELGKRVRVNARDPAARAAALGLLRDAIARIAADAPGPDALPPKRGAR